MTTLRERTWNEALRYAVKDNARIMQIGGERGFLFCSASQRNLEQVWPLLQAQSPFLERCSNSKTPYGYAFPMNLWPHFKLLSVRLDEVWARKYLQGAGIKVSEKDLNSLRSLAYLRSAISRANELHGLSFAHDGWESMKIVFPKDTVKLYSKTEKLPGAVWLGGWESEICQNTEPSLKVTTSFNSQVEASPILTKTLCLPSPLPNVFKNRNERKISSVELERFSEEAEDFVNKLKGKPLEQILGNY